MIPGTLNSDTHITQIEIQNEIKTSEIKTPVNKSTSSVKFSDSLKQENVKECDNTAGISKNTNEDTAHSNAQKCGKLIQVSNFNKMEKGDTNATKEGLSSENKKIGIYPTKFWVQHSEEDESPRDDGRMEYIPGRNSFVAKVFSITFLMIIITIALVSTAASSPGLRRYFTDALYGGLLFTAGICGMLCLNLKVMCSPCMRMFPSNILILVIAVSCMSLVAACVTCANETRMIIYAMLATATTVFVCYLLAFTRLDFTKYLVYIFGIGITFIVVSSIVLGVMVETGIRYKPIELLLLYLGTMCITTILIMKLQLILGGKSIALAEKDYALGAFMLYTSVVDLFLRLLQMCGLTLIEDEDILDDVF